MRTKYETEDDLAKEAMVRLQLGAELGVELHKIPTSYGVDAMATNATGSLAYWFEVKCRPGMTWGQYPDVIVSVLKLRAAAGLKAATNTDTWFAVADSTGEIRVANLCRTERDWIRIGGRTLNTRDAADIEPVCHIPVDRFYSPKELWKWDQ